MPGTKRTIGISPLARKKRTNLDSLKAAIKNCGVCFNTWEKKNADGKGSGSYDLFDGL